MNRKNNNKKRNIRGRSTNERAYHLPVLNTNVVVKHKYRFVAGSAAVSQVITSNNLLSCAGTVGTVVNSTLSLIFASVRLRHIEIWGGAAVGGTGQTISIEWTGTGNTPNLEYSDTTLSATNPSHLRLAPPKNTLASFWQLSTASVNLFQITVPTGSVVDVTLDLILSDTALASTTITGVTTVVLGEVYYLAMDGISPARFTPVRLTTTT